MYVCVCVGVSDSCLIPPGLLSVAAFFPFFFVDVGCWFPSFQQRRNRTHTHTYIYIYTYIHTYIHTYLHFCQSATRALHLQRLRYGVCRQADGWTNGQMLWVFNCPLSQCIKPKGCVLLTCETSGVLFLNLSFIPSLIHPFNSIPLSSFWQQQQQHKSRACSSIPCILQTHRSRVGERASERATAVGKQ